MKKPHLLIGTNAALLVLVFLMLAQSLLVAQRVAHSGEIRGNVLLARAGQSERAAVQPGSALAAGDTVYTGRNSTAEYRWPDGTRWKLMPNSAITLKSSAFNSLQRSQDTSLHLTAGRVLVRVPRHLGAKDQFVVSTPHFSARVRGTVFAVQTNHCRSMVKVLNGTVEIQDSAAHPSAPVMVMAGTQFRSTAYGDKTQISPLTGTVFQGQNSITAPEVEARVEPGQGDRALLQISTESGDIVRVNGQRLTTMHGGVWEMPVQLKRGRNSWLVESTDIHGKVSRSRPVYEHQLPGSSPLPKRG